MASKPMEGKGLQFRRGKRAGEEVFCIYRLVFICSAHQNKKLFVLFFFFCKGREVEEKRLRMLHCKQDPELQGFQFSLNMEVIWGSLRLYLSVPIPFFFSIGNFFSFLVLSLWKIWPHGGSPWLLVILTLYFLKNIIFY